MLVLNTNPTATMTSREIAELTGKCHDNVMRDIAVMLEQLHGDGGILKFADTYVNTQNGQTYPMYRLLHDETICLLNGYDTTSSD
jgi:Rha family phage regulatory protein